MPSPDIALVILDFDGVLTDNRVYVMEDGREAVVCHRGDGGGVGILQQAGIEVMILSAKRNPVVSARTEKLGIECRQNCSDKTAATAALIEEKGIDPARVMYVGNDANDAGGTPDRASRCTPQHIKDRKDHYQSKRLA